MRAMLLATATAAALCVGAAAHAQSADAGPMSTTATHINKADTGSTIAPRLPAPGAGDSTPDQFLAAAKRDVMSGRTGAAQEALERAETRILDRSTDPSMANQPDASPRVDHIHNALHMLAGKDRAGTAREIDAAMGDNMAPMAGGNAPMAPMTPMAAPMTSTAPREPLNTPIAPGGTSGLTPSTATGGNATGLGVAPTAVGGNTPQGASNVGNPVTP